MKDMGGPIGGTFAYKMKNSSRTIATIKQRQKQKLALTSKTHLPSTNFSRQRGFVMASAAQTTTFAEQTAFAAKVAKETAAVEWAVQQVNQIIMWSNRLYACLWLSRWYRLDFATKDGFDIKILGWRLFTMWEGLHVVSPWRFCSCPLGLALVSWRHNLFFVFFYKSTEEQQEQQQQRRRVRQRRTTRDGQDIFAVTFFDGDKPK